MTNAISARQYLCQFQLTLLYKRTGAIGFCCIGRSDVGDTLKPACVGREAVKFFPHVLHTTDNQFAMKFDNYTCNRDSVGTEVNFNTLRSQTIGMIGDGLGKYLIPPVAPAVTLTCEFSYQSGQPARKFR